MTTTGTFHFSDQACWREATSLVVKLLIVAGVVFMALRGMDVYASPGLDLDEVKVAVEQYTPQFGDHYDWIPVPCRGNQAQVNQKHCLERAELH